MQSRFIPDNTASHLTKHYASDLQYIKGLYLPLSLGVHLMSDAELIIQGDSKVSIHRDFMVSACTIG